MSRNQLSALVAKCKCAIAPNLKAQQLAQFCGSQICAFLIPLSAFEVLMKFCTARVTSDAAMTVFRCDQLRRFMFASVMDCGIPSPGC